MKTALSSTKMRNCQTKIILLKNLKIEYDSDDEDEMEVRMKPRITDSRLQLFLKKIHKELSKGNTINDKVKILERRLRNKVALTQIHLRTWITLSSAIMITTSIRRIS